MNEELVLLIDAEIQYYLKRIELHKRDKDKDVRPGLKARDPFPLETCLDIVSNWDTLPKWKKIIYDVVLPHSALYKCIENL